MTIKQVNQLPIWQIDNFETGLFCTNFITDRMDLFQSPDSHYPAFYRNNDRYEEMASSQTAIWFAKLQAYPAFKDAKGLNAKLRTCRYTKGQSFSKHQDGVHFPSEGIASRYTFLLYLNDASEFEGGDTVFYSHKNAKEPVHTIRPKKGTLVLFDHRIWHQGETLRKGSKYIVRSDLYVVDNSKKKGHQGYIWTIASGDAQTFWSGGRDGLVKHWANTNRVLDSFKIHEQSVIRVLPYTDSIMVSSSRDFSLVLWDTHGKVLLRKKLKAMVLDVLVYQESIIAIDTNGCLLVFHSDLELRYSCLIAYSWLWKMIRIGDAVYCVSEDGALYCFSLKKNSFTKVYQHSKALFTLCPSDDFLILGDKEGQLVLVDKHTYKLETIVKVHADRLTDVLVYKDYIYSVGEDGGLFQTNLLSKSSKLLYRSTAFLQGLIVCNDAIIVAGYDGTCTSITWGSL